MIVLGSTSEVAQAFVEKMLKEGEKIETIYLFTSCVENTERFAKHIEVKYFQKSEVIKLDLLQVIDFNSFKNIDSDILFCATGYLGQNSVEGLYNQENTNSIIEINYSKLILVINYFAQKMERKRKGVIIGLSSVAGDRGRYSNFIYGSAKAAFSTYLDGLRNYLFEKNVHVITVKPGFMRTKMTEGMDLFPAITATPQQAANILFKAYKRKSNSVYILPIWKFIMLIIGLIPERIFKRLKL